MGTRLHSSPELDTLVSATLDETNREAEQVVAVARDHAEEALARAQRLAVEEIRRGRQRGRDEVAEELGGLRAEVRGRARSTVLRAQREVYETFRGEAHIAADRLRLDPSYVVLLESLGEQARSRLGTGAEVEIDEDVGGVVGRAHGRRVAYTIPALVERCIGRMGSRIGELWA